MSRRKWKRAALIFAVVALVVEAARLFLPRTLSEIYGDRIFLRHDLSYPDLYRIGGLEVGGLNIGGRKVDCRGLERPLVREGVNLLANPGLDGPCGWVFAPFLGNKARKGRRDGPHFCIDHDGDLIYQDVRLEAFAGSAAAGALNVKVSGRLRADRSAASGNPYLYGEALADEWNGPVLAHLAGGAPARGEEWRKVSDLWRIPAGAKVLRLFLGRSAVEGGGRGATACFDDLSVEALPAGAFAPGM